MEPTYFERLYEFIKIGFQTRFTTAFKGFLLGLVGSLNFLWSGPVDSPVVVYMLKILGTIFITAGTTFTTLYVTYKFENWKEKKSTTIPKKRKNKAA